MAITYNQQDAIYYGFNADRLADTEIVQKKTAKFFEYDTDTLYISDGATWYAVS